MIARTHLRPSRFWHAFVSRMMAYVASMFSDLRVEGLHNVPKRGGAVVVSNHFSYFDAFALTTALDRTKRDSMVLAKAELFKNTFMGALLRRVGVIAVHRGTDKAKDSLSEAVNSVKHGEIVSLFPEGTIPHDGRLAPFKTGAVRMALAANAPIVPVAMVGTNTVIASNMTKVKRTLWRRSVKPSPVRVLIGEPIMFTVDPEDRAAVAAATEQLHDVVESMLVSMGYEPATGLVASVKKHRKWALTAVPVLGAAVAAWRKRT